MTDTERNRADIFCCFFECGKIGVNEISALEQVARRIAAEKQFRRENEFCAERAGFFVTGQKLPAVVREIADGRIELEQADFQRNQDSLSARFRNALQSFDAAYGGGHAAEILFE
jgi:hypothetical protein